MDASSCCPSCQLPEPKVPRLPWPVLTNTNHLLRKDRLGTQRGRKMLPDRKKFSAPEATSEGPFPLGPFPRHIWIHVNTPWDSLDEVCREIWKRVQRLPKELQPPALQHTPPSDQPGTLRRDTQSNNYLLDEPEGLESIYRAMIGNREREMKIRALCDAHLSSKSVTSSLLCSAKSPKNSKEDGSATGAHSTEGSKLEVPFPPKCTDSAKGVGNQATTEEAKVAREFLPNSTLSSAKSGTAAAESQATGQKQQLPVFAKICSKPDSDEVPKNPVTTATLDKKNIKYNASILGFSTTAVMTPLNEPAWQSLSFAPFSIFPNHTNLPQFQGPYHQRARIPYQQALHPPFGCYSRQVAPFGPQQIFQPPYPPMLNYIPLVQPGYPYQQVIPPTLSSNTRDLPATAGERNQYPFAPPYGFSSRPGGAVTTNLNYWPSDTYAKF